MTTSQPGSPSGAKGSPVRLDPSEFSCSICFDLCLDPVVGNCGHDFCARCIEAWRTSRQRCGRSVQCPICRAVLLPSTDQSFGVCIRLKDTIDKLFPEQIKVRRREAEEADAKAALQAAEAQADSDGVASPRGNSDLDAFASYAETYRELSERLLSFVGGSSGGSSSQSTSEFGGNGYQQMLQRLLDSSLLANAQQQHPTAEQLQRTIALLSSQQQPSSPATPASPAPQLAPRGAAGYTELSSPSTLSDAAAMSAAAAAMAAAAAAAAASSASTTADFASSSMGSGIPDVWPQRLSTPEPALTQLLQRLLLQQELAAHAQRSNIAAAANIDRLMRQIATARHTHNPAAAAAVAAATAAASRYYAPQSSAAQPLQVYASTQPGARTGATCHWGPSSTSSWQLPQTQPQYHAFVAANGHQLCGGAGYLQQQQQLGAPGPYAYAASQHPLQSMYGMYMGSNSSTSAPMQYIQATPVYPGMLQHNWYA